MEKVSSNKKNARGDAKLRLSVDRGPMLVMLTITDIDGATHKLRAVTAVDNAFVPIKHPSTTIEATAIPFAPDELLERLRRVEAKVKRQRDQHCEPQSSACSSASAAEMASVDVEKASAQSQEHMAKGDDGPVTEYIRDPEKGTVAVKSNCCSMPFCNDVNCPGAPTTYTVNVKTGEIESIDGPQVDEIVDPRLKGCQESPRCYLNPSIRFSTILNEEKAIRDKLWTAKPREKKRLNKGLEKTKVEYAKVKNLVDRTAGTGKWLSVPREERFALLEKAKQKDPECVDALARRAIATVDEYNKIIEKLEPTSSQPRERRLFKLLQRKEHAFDEAMNEIAVIADDSEGEHGSECDDGSEDEDGIEQDSKEQLNDVPICTDEALIFVFFSVLVLLLLVIVFMCFYLYLY